MESTSLTLIELLQDPQDEDAWGRFVQLYAPMLKRSVERFGLQEAETADIVQDVLIVLQRKMPEFEYDPERSFRSWLRTVSANRCRDFLRKRNRNPHQAKSSYLLRLVDGDDIALFTDQEYHTHVVRQALMLMQADFQENTWRACWLHVVEERPASEIADELGISTNAVFIAKSRVLRRLRERLDGLL